MSCSDCYDPNKKCPINCASPIKKEGWNGAGYNPRPPAPIPKYYYSRPPAPIPKYYYTAPAPRYYTSPVQNLNYYYNPPAPEEEPYVTFDVKLWGGKKQVFREYGYKFIFIPKKHRCCAKAEKGTYIKLDAYFKKGIYYYNSPMECYGIKLRVKKIRD
jgi:hypothetical protein